MDSKQQTIDRLIKSIDYQKNKMIKAKSYLDEAKREFESLNSLLNEVLHDIEY